MRPFLIFILINIISAYAIAPAKSVPIGDLPLENGQVILDCQVTFRTFGKLNADSSNVVLYPTWFSGTTAHLAAVSAPGKIVDSTQYYIIALAALGNGESSSPSNSAKQRGGKFPQFNIRDMVRSQYLMLKQEFGFKQVLAVIGGSMGSMQSYEWMLLYPDFMKKVVAYVATPRVASSDVLRFQLKLNMILQQGVKEEEVWANLSAFTYLTAYTTSYLTQHTPAEELDHKWQIWRNQKHESFTLFDYAAQLRAMLQHNIYFPYGNDRAKTASHINAGFMLIVSESDQILNPQPALEFAEYLQAKKLLLKGNCGHLEPGCQMELVSKEINQFLKNN